MHSYQLKEFSSKHYQFSKSKQKYYEIFNEEGHGQEYVTFIFQKYIQIGKIIKQQELEQYRQMYSTFAFIQNILKPLGYMIIKEDLLLVRAKKHLSINQLVEQKHISMKYLNPSQLKIIIKQLFETFLSIHNLYKANQRFLHGNIKLENILISQDYKIYLVDFALNQMVDVKAIQDEIFALGYIFFQIASLKPNQSQKTIKNLILQKVLIQDGIKLINQFYGEKLGNLIISLMEKNEEERHYLNQIYQEQYAEYMSIDLNNESIFFKNQFKKEQDFINTLISEFKESIIKRSAINYWCKDANFYFSKHLHGQDINHSATLNQLMKDSNHRLFQMNEFEKELFYRYYHQIKYKHFDITVFQKPLSGLNKVQDFEDLQDKIAQTGIEEAQEQFILQSTFQQKILDIFNKKDQLKQKNKSLFDIFNQVKNPSSGQSENKIDTFIKQLESIRQLKQQDNFRDKDAEKDSLIICHNIKQFCLMKNIKYVHLLRQFQQYDPDRDQFVVDYVFLFIMKKNFSDKTREELQPLIRNFRSKHQQKKKKKMVSKSRFIDYLKFLSQIFDENDIKQDQEQIESIDCESLINKIQQCCQQRNLDLRQELISFAEYYHISTISFDGWMYLMGNLFSQYFTYSDFQDLFNNFDKNPNGEILINDIIKKFDKKQYQKLFKQLTNQMIAQLEEEKKDIDEYFQELDQNQDKTLDILEFELIVKRLIKDIDHQDLIAVFDRFDLNRSGQININEFKNCMQSYIQKYRGKYSEVSSEQSIKNLLADDQEDEDNQNPLLNESKDSQFLQNRILLDENEFFNIIKNRIDQTQPMNEFENFIEFTVQTREEIFRVGINTMNHLLDQMKNNSVKLAKLQEKNLNYLLAKLEQKKNQASTLRQRRQNQNEIEENLGRVDVSLVYSQNDNSKVDESIQPLPVNRQQTIQKSKLFQHRQQSTLLKMSTIQYQNNISKKQTKQLIEFQKLIKNACQDRGINPFDLFTQFDSEAEDFQIENLKDLELALEQIELPYSQDDVELLFKKFIIPGKKSMAVMKLCSMISSDLNQLTLRAINYFIQKYRLEPKLFFMKIQEQGKFTENSLKLINSEFHWNIEEKQLNETYQQISALGQLDEKNFIINLKKVADQCDDRLDQIHYKDFIHILLFKVGQFEQLRSNYFEADPNRTGILQILDFYKLTEYYLGRTLQKNEKKAINKFLAKDDPLCVNYSILIDDVTNVMENYNKQQKEMEEKDRQTQRKLMTFFLQSFPKKENKVDEENLIKYYFTSDNRFLIDEQTFINTTKVLPKNLLDESQIMQIYKFLKKQEHNQKKGITINTFKQFIKMCCIEYMNDEFDPKQQLEDFKITNDIYNLFQKCDQNKNNYLDKKELHEAMKLIGINPTNQQLQELFHSIDKNNDSVIDYKEFETIMMDKCIQDIYHGKSLMYEIRKHFKIYSHQKHCGITIELLDQIIKKLGYTINPDDLQYVFTYIDSDNSGQIDLREFLHFIKNTSPVKVKDQRILKFLFLLRGYEKLTIMDLLEHFQSLPPHFQLSFVRQNNSKRLNLPSSAFKLEPDQTGTTIKNLFINQSSVHRKDKESILDRTLPCNMMIKIKLIEAEGVPVPDSSKIKTPQILLREVGVLIYDKFKGTFKENCVYIKGKWTEKGQDIWSFKRKNQKEGFFLRYCTFDKKADRDLSLVFEFIIYIKNVKDQNNKANDQIYEVSCCYAEVPLMLLYEKTGDILINLQGGSPGQPIPIKKEDIKSERSGWKKVEKVFGKIHSTLKINISKNIKRKELLQQLHSLPNLCLIPRTWTSLVQAFREWCAREALSEGHQIDLEILTNPLQFSFHYYLDCPDISDKMNERWNTAMKDYQGNMQYTQKSFKLLVNRLLQCTNNISFKFDPVHSTDRKFDPTLVAARAGIVNNILNFWEHQIGEEVKKQKLPQFDINLITHPDNVANHIPFDSRDDLFENQDEEQYDKLVQIQNKIQ